MNEEKMIDKNSLLYWYPRIKELGIPIPRTGIVKIEYDWEYFCEFIDRKNNLGKYQKEIKEKAERIGYPLFVRTDYISGKHDWKRACFVEEEKYLIPHLRVIVEASFMADIIGLPINAIVLREYIPLDTAFTAFYGEMPVARERRYFIKDGDVLCHHPYWIEDSIINPSVKNWQELLRMLNIETAKELILLSNFSQRVADRFDGYWSIDFAQAKAGDWYLIDMALGADSWHPSCEKTPTLFKERKVKQEEDIVKLKTINEESEEQ